MVTIRVFIPHLDMKRIFDEVVENLPKQNNVDIDTVYVFGTPDEILSRNGDADILVARGMSCDKLRSLFPSKHVIEIEMNSFEMLDALIACQRQGAHTIALMLHHVELHNPDSLEKLTGARILYYDVSDERATEAAVEDAWQKGADMFVGAGTMCGICDRRGFARVHIKTRYEAIRAAMLEAMEAAKTINYERERTELFNSMLNHSEEGILGMDDGGRILAINNQAHRIFKLSTIDSVKGKQAADLLDSSAWRSLLEQKDGAEQILEICGNQYYVLYTPVNEEVQSLCGLIFIRNTNRIMEEESKVRRGLAEKGLTAKYSFADILGRSKAIRDNIMVAEKYSRVNSNVLLLGESGTGKELFAHSIHRASKRSKEPFVALNCAALPEALLESELFGYESGAFSGAAKGGKVGLFELANKGTIFLDEVGEIPVSLQAKLLRVLQEKEIRRIGSTSVHPVDVRVISATNINFEEEIAKGNFRADLYYRLNLLDLSILPLRERKEDIQDLVDHYLTRFACDMEKPIPHVTEEAARLLREYSWPGNVRELRNVCERLIVLNDTDSIDEELLLHISIFRDTHDALENKEGSLPDAAEAAPQEKAGKAPEKKKNSAEEEATELTGAELTEYQELSRMMQRKGRKRGKKELAEELGVSRTTLWRMQKKLKAEKEAPEQGRNESPM